MGIPLYFKKLTKDFHDVVQKEIPKEQYSRLFFDFNCAIHKCSNELKKKHALKPLSHKNFEIELIKKCKEFIMETYELLKPTDLMYVAIDGVVPMAKIAQQRKRRYFNDWKRSRLMATCLDHKKTQEYNLLKYEWNSNAITPGTSFMKVLCLDLDAYSKKLEEDLGIKVIVSYGNGEGEHKICHFIRQEEIKRKKTNVYGSDIIYGLDADMILLSMLSPNSDHTYLLRENTYNESEYIYMNIKNTKTQIYQQFCEMLEEEPTMEEPTIEEPTIEETNEKKINFYIQCYVCLTFLLGNDFLPNLTYISLRTNGMVQLLNAYKETFYHYDKEQHILVDSCNSDLKMNQIFLKRLLDILSKNEDDELGKLQDIYYGKTIFYKKPHSTFIQQETLKLENYPCTHKYPEHLVDFKTTGWRSHYYYHLFEKNTRSESVSLSCKMYIQGLQWICDYYFNQKTEWYWFYMYDYSPTMIDLSNCSHLSVPEKEEEEEQNDNITEDEQQLMVLPPSSSHLICDDHTRSMMTDISSKMIHCFPVEFNVITFMKNQLHECGGFGLNLRNKLTVKKFI
jgi:5'-3' exonuclease